MTCFSAGASPIIMRRAAARGQLFLQQDVFGQQPPLRQRALDHQQQMIGIDGLGQKIERPLFHRRDGVLNAAVGRHHDHGQLRIEFLRGTKDAKTVALQAAEDRSARALAATAASPEPLRADPALR